MKKFGRVTTALTILAMLLTGSSNAFAAASSSSSTSGAGTGYRLSPVRTDLTLNPGADKTVTLYITDVSNAPESLRVVANDFTAKDETGTPALLLNGQDLPQFGLKQYLQLPSGTITLQPGQQTAVNVEIKLPPNIPAGGHYGAVRFVPASTSGSSSVNLAASVASLILVRVSGNVREQVSLASFDVRKNGVAHSFFTSGKGLQAVARFQNSGQVQEQPFGKVLLQKGGKTLASYEINNTDPKGNVLPGSIRRFNVNLDKVGSFGKYQVVGNFGYGSNGQLLSAASTFYVVPVVWIIIVIVVIALILFLIFGLPRLVKSYNRRILRRARRY